MVHHKHLTLLPLLLAVSNIFSCYAFSPGFRSLAKTTLIREPSPLSSSHHHRRLHARTITDQLDAAEKSTSADVRPSQRRIANTEKFARLPVWPVWQGVFLFFASKIFGQEIAAQWEDAIGGRVCPNFFTPTSTDPFVLLVHHRHAFMNWDPVRYIQATFFPEGFPAHPHRGFMTVTYILKGGFFHRDSLGIKQSYGAEERHEGEYGVKHVQWLTAGAGIQHEEMWDVSEPDKKDKGKWLWTSSQELYQIWLNLPAADKMSTPDAKLLEAYPVDGSISPPADTTPIVTSEDGSTITTIVSGEHNGIKAPFECPTNAAIIRIEFTSQKDTPSIWTHTLPATHEFATLYIRKGSVQIDGQRIPPHHTVFLTPGGEQLTIKALEGEADVLLLSGEPLREPIASQGSMVMNTEGEIQNAYSDYQRGLMGMPWSEKLSDDEWREHVKQNPSKY